ncbi:MAG: oligopeptidase B, partial [Flavobacteriales bacterium]|nr:oligopeptidase B [Flavobacteriales bacterium]
MRALPFILILAACRPATTMERPVPPRPDKEPHLLSLHGHDRTDPYFWMRLSEEQRDADPPDAHTQRVIDHLNAENAYAEAVLAPVKDLRDSLYAEMRGRIKETDMSVPYRENGYWYHHRFEEGKEYAVHVRREDREGAPEVDFLDENKLSEGHAYFDLADFEVSPGNGLVCYSVDTVGRRVYELRFLDLRTGEEL